MTSWHRFWGEGERRYGPKWNELKARNGLDRSGMKASLDVACADLKARIDVRWIGLKARVVAECTYGGSAGRLLQESSGLGHGGAAPCGPDGQGPEDGPQEPFPLGTERHDGTLAR